MSIRRAALAAALSRAYRWALAVQWGERVLLRESALWAPGAKLPHAATYSGRTVAPAHTCPWICAKTRPMGSRMIRSARPS